jgi:hypothetical protein
MKSINVPKLVDSEIEFITPAFGLLPEEEIKGLRERVCAVIEKNFDENVHTDKINAANIVDDILQSFEEIDLQTLMVIALRELINDDVTEIYYKRNKPEMDALEEKNNSLKERLEGIMKDVREGLQKEGIDIDIEKEEAPVPTKTIEDTNYRGIKIITLAISEPNEKFGNKEDMLRSVGIKATYEETKNTDMKIQGILFDVLKENEGGVSLTRALSEVLFQLSSEELHMFTAMSLFASVNSGLTKLAIKRK